MAVSMISASSRVGAAGGLLQAARIATVRTKKRNVLPEMFTFHHL
jgi:hypothetical protein